MNPGYSSTEKKKLKHPRRLMDSTSKFRKIDSDSLNIIYQGVQELSEIIPRTNNKDNSRVEEFFYLSNIEIPMSPDIKNTKKEKTLIKYINKIRENENIAIGTEESNTDSFVDYILRKLDLDEDPFLLRIHKMYKFSVGDKTISSIPEFSIEKDDVVVFIDEDKHLNNITPGKSWGEYQIAGEIIAAAATNYNNQVIRNALNIMDCQTIYCIRVIGTKFTFYKSRVSSKYLMQLEDGFPEEDLIISRFPSDRGPFSFMDYTNPSQREIILDAFSAMKHGL